MPSLKNSLFGSAVYVTHFYPTLKLRVARPNFILKDLPSVLILIIADQIVNDSQCCSNKYN